ncbi:MAG: hypothetical protein P4L44_04265 [Oryzomonas sp.]|uniref:hypothetical protein n=1 Tax=Oryzomonas sp. TaxID=2855186 RepID=UPI00284DEBAE|nr:hypothetical protein [Oryzomonas sp.]MDR3579163.1 hypothetical protein [Oryzomonas sp.]
MNATTNEMQQGTVLNMQAIEAMDASEYRESLKARTTQGGEAVIIIDIGPTHLTPIQWLKQLEEGRLLRNLVIFGV